MEYEIRNEKYIILARVSRKISTVDGRGNYGIRCGKPSGTSDLEGMTVKTIPAQTWAVFRDKGPMPASIQETWKRIYGEWFPASQYEHSGGPELEVYPEEDQPGEMPYEIWIPVKRK
jgi:AraC family transcriptional regulator